VLANRRRRGGVELIKREYRHPTRAPARPRQRGAADW
jgi:hypothetical protein